MSFGDTFHVNRKDGTGGGLVHPKGVKSMAMFGLGGRKALVGTGWPISVLFGINGLKVVSNCRASVSSIQGPFISYTRLVFSWVWL